MKTPTRPSATKNSRTRGVAAMAAADDFFPPPPKSGAASIASIASLEQRSQLDFDIAFNASGLERQPDYLDALRCQGESLTRKGLHERALSVDRRLAQLLPGDNVVQYNLACSLTMMGLLDEALAALRTALESGFDDLDYLRADSDLDGLRNEPGYEALLQEFEPKD